MTALAEQRFSAEETRRSLLRGNYDPNIIEPANFQHISQYVADWRQLTNYYLFYVPNDFADRVSESHSYEILQNDEAIYQALDLLCLDAAGDFLEVRCQDKALEFLLNTAINYIDDFSHSRKSLIYGTTLFGLGLQRKEWKKVQVEAFPGKIFSFPCLLKEADRRRLRIERPYGSRTEQYWTIYSQKYDQYVKMKSKSNFPNYECCIEDYVWSYYEFEETSPYFRGLGAVLFRLAYMRSKVLPYWGELMERWGEPVVCGQINAMKGAFDAEGLGSGWTAVAQRMDKMIEQWEKMKKRNVFLMDRNGDQIDIKDPGLSGSNMLLEFLEYADGRIEKILLGADLVAGSGSGRGSYALGEMHEGKFNLKSDYLKRRAEESYKSYLVYDIVWRNAMVLSSMGIKIPDKQEISVEIVSNRKRMKQRLVEKTISEADAKRMVDAL